MKLKNNAKYKLFTYCNRLNYNFSGYQAGLIVMLNDRQMIDEVERDRERERES